MMRLMKTAEEMIQFCVDNNTGYYSATYLNHFKVIEDCLQADEYAIFCLEGSLIIDLDFRSTRDLRYSFSLTNKRLLMGQNSTLGQDLQVVWYKDLDGIEVVNRSLLVDTVKNVPCMMIESEDVSYVQKTIAGIMSEIKRTKTASKVIKEISPADEIRKYKGLRDDGIITEEEFQKKKEQLLNGDDALEQLESDTEVVIDINSADNMPAGEKAVSTKETKLNEDEKEASDNRWKVILYSFCIIGGIISLLGFLTAAGAI